LPRTGRAVVLLIGCLVALWPAVALAHSERPTTAPDGSGHVPEYRQGGPQLLVCKADPADFAQRIAGFSPSFQRTNQDLFTRCLANGYRDLQAAVDHVTEAGTTIEVLPGLYREEPSLAPDSDACNHLAAPRAKAGYQILSYQQQKTCPHQQNLVGIFGVKDLQIEGTGPSPGDVVFDAQFQKLNVIRGDRSYGLYLRNFTAERSTFNAVYVIETDGFVIDSVVGRWNSEYGFLSFASDHGLIKDCEAYGNGDSGIYPGGTSDINRDQGYDVPRYAIEVTGCRSHNNTLGYSGTGGDSVWVHDNVLDHNMGGASMDSLFPNHPGLPQNHALFERNRIYSNNSNYYPQVRDGTCAKPFPQQGIEQGVVCPAVPVPVGVGIIVIGGNYDVFRGNVIYDNWKLGFAQTWVPGLVRNDFNWDAQWETSHFNRYTDNTMGVAPDGKSMPNGVDFFWDGEGEGNCWQAEAGTSVEPLVMPGCPAGALHRYLADPNRLVLFVDCSNYDLATRNLPMGCDWFETPVRPGSLPNSMNAMSVAPAVQAFFLVVVFAWLLFRRSRLDAFATATMVEILLGSAVLFLASLEPLWYLTPAGIAILGLGWLSALRLVPGRLLALWTLLLGLVALAEAIDAGIVLLPLPVAVVWIRLGMELVWVVWTVRNLIRARNEEGFAKPIPVPE